MADVLLVFNRNHYGRTKQTRMAELAQWVKEADNVISF